MKKLSLILALCAFVAAPAFASDDHHAAPTATEAAPANHEASATHGDTKPMKKNTKKMKHGKRGANKAAPAPAHGDETATDAPKAE